MMNSFDNTNEDYGNIERPDEVFEELIVEKNGLTKMYPGDFRVYYDGFDWMGLVDRNIPIPIGSTVYGRQSDNVVSRGRVFYSAEYMTTTEFHVEPDVELIYMD